MNLEQSMARILNRLMENAQTSLNEITYALDDMSYYDDKLREDVDTCKTEIKEKVKASVAEHWVILNKWAQHFDGITEPEEE